MNKATLLLSMSVLFLANTPVVAADAAAGQAKSAVCAACHGADGNSPVPMYPHLAGQHATYLENALKAYRDGQRKGGLAAMMVPMASSLTDADIANIAAYFSQQKLKQK